MKPKLKSKSFKQKIAEVGRELAAIKAQAEKLLAEIRAGRS